VLALLGAGVLGVAAASCALLGRVHDRDAERAALHALRQVARLALVERAAAGLPTAPDALVARREELRQLLTRVKAATGDDFAVVLRKDTLDRRAWEAAERGARTWDDRPDVVVVETTSFTGGVVDYHGDVAALPEGGVFLEEVEGDGRALVRGAFPLRDADRSVVGALFVLHDFSFVRDGFEASRNRGAFAVAGLAALVLAVVALALERLVFGRLAALRSGLEETLPVPAPPPEAHSCDEIARLAILIDAAACAPPRRAARPP
jgi:hypothetical protein